MNFFGKIFRISLYGESHSDAIGIILDGVPAGIKVNYEDLQEIINSRKSGKIGTTARTENDIPIFTSGIYDSVTTGAPIHIYFKNENQISKDYNQFRNHPRPSHSDYVANIKFNNYNDIRGGGTFSGRLTLLLVAAGYFAKLILPEIDIQSQIIELHGSKDFDYEIHQAINFNDSIGGIIECRISNLPIGLGEPFFDSVESVISHLVFSIPGIKGIEFGAGFQSTKMYGSENNDLIIDKNGKTQTNNAGGINGGITNGNEIIFKVAVKPTSGIGKEQMTYNFAKNQIEKLQITGRHDTCFALRVPPVINAVSYIALADLMLLRKAQSI